MEGGTGGDPVTITIATILGYLGNVVDFMIDSAEDVMTFIASEPLILVFVLLPLVGIGVGLIKRLIR